MGRSYVERVYDWVRALVGVSAEAEPGPDHEGLQCPRQWQPFDPAHHDEPRS